MIINKIEIEDFRSFYGKQTLEMSVDNEINVTLIIAQNGSGKTNLLNAIRLCFHNDCSENFRERKEIINHQALKEGKQEAKISITFTHNEEKFVAERKWLQSTSQSKKDFGADFTINKVERGNWTPIKAPNDVIAKIFPRSMAENFAFDGEGAVKMTSKEQAVVLKDSTRDILGTHYVEHALKDLNKLNRLIKKQLSESDTEEEEKNVSITHENYEKDLEELQKQLNDIKDEQNRTRSQLNDINKALIGVESTAPLMKSLLEKRKELEKKEVEMDMLKKQKMEWLNKSGRAVLSGRLNSLTDEIMENAKASGKIPYEYSQPFIQKIIEKKVCICGRPFDEHSEEEKKIIRMTDSAGSVRVNEEIKDISNLRYHLGEIQKNSHSEFREIERNVKQKNSEITAIEAFLRDIETQLDNVPNVDNVDEKIDQRKILEAKMNKYLEETGAITHQIKDVEEKKNEVSKKLSELLSRNPKNNKLRSKIKIIETSIERIKSIIETETNEAKNIIEEKVNNILSEALRKNFACKIKDDFQLEFFDAITKNPIIPSDGETVVLTLAYVSSLIEFCKERISNDNEYLINGISAPLILDAPFSSLDNLYIRNVVNFVPEMSNQIILMLNLKDFKTVEPYLKHKISSLWIGKIHSSKEDGDSDKNEEAVIFDNNVTLRDHGSSHTYTEFSNIQL